MINELSLQSGGEYTVHILLHVEDKSLAVWGDPSMLQEVVRQNVPQEFWGLVTPWSERYMEKIYSTPFGPPFENPSPQEIHSSYRSLHMPLQWFAYEHSEYDFSGIGMWIFIILSHYYKFFDRLGTWGMNSRGRACESAAQSTIFLLSMVLGKLHPTGGH